MIVIEQFDWTKVRPLGVQVEIDDDRNVQVFTSTSGNLLAVRSRNGTRCNDTVVLTPESAGAWAQALLVALSELDE